MKILVLLIGVTVSSFAWADWYHGKIYVIGIGYDGKTIAVGIENFSKNDCTCYKAWPNRICLNRERESFSEEYALLLSAKARNKSVAIRVNGETCEIRAMYES